MNKWQFTFTGNWPTLPVIILGALAALVACWFYRQQRKKIPHHVFVILCVLRSILILTIALFLLHPVIRYASTQNLDNPVLILVDASESMGIHDTPNGRSRLDTSLELLRSEPYNLLERLQRDHKIRLFSFGSRIEEQDPANSIGAEKPATAIGDALNDAVSRVGTRSVSDVILLTDGVNTTGTPPQEAARYLGVPIHTVTVGGKSAERGRFTDIGISGAPGNHRFVVDNRATLPIQITHRGLDTYSKSDRTVALTLHDNGEELASEKVTLAAEDGPTEVELEYTPEETGIHELHLSLPVLPDETILKNNERTFTVQVTNPRIRVLFVEGVVRAEYRFLRRALASDPNLRLTSVVKLTKEQFYQQGIEPGFPLRQGLPIRREEYESFDVIILGNVRRQEFKQDQIELLKQHVQDGGGLFVMGGHNAYGSGGWSGTALADVLPVTIDDGDSFNEAEFQPLLTDVGKAHAVFSGCAPFFSPGDEQVTLRGMNEIDGLKEGASVLCFRSGGDNAHKTQPIVAVQQSGSGQVIALTSNSTWKWRFQVDGSGLDSPYYRFWRQSLRWLNNPTEQPTSDGESVNLRAWTDQTSYEPGETVTVQANLSGINQGEADAGIVQAHIECPQRADTSDGDDRGQTAEHKRLTLQPSPMSPGRYKTTFKPSASGTYEGTATFSSDEIQVDPSDFRFVVGHPVREFDHVDVDETAMRQTAIESGGTYHTAATAVRIAEKIADKRRNMMRREELSLWNAPLFFIFILGCATLEWILRKHYGLS